MPRRKAKQKEADVEKVIDSFESWLEKQPPKPVRAKSGFIGDAKIEGSS
jgi:hypothetical protein